MISTFLRSLNPRERLLLFVGATAVLLSVLYVAVIEPGYQRLNMLRSQVPAKMADIAWMEEQIRRYGPILSQQGAVNQDTRRPLLTVVEQTATRVGLRQNITRMQPAEQGSVRIWFDDVGFESWLLWVEELREQSVLVTVVTIERTDPGKVNIRLTLKS